MKLILSVANQLKELETFSNSGGKEFELDTYANKKCFPWSTHTLLDWNISDMFQSRTKKILVQKPLFHIATLTLIPV